MKNSSKKIFAMLMAALFLIGMVPTMAFAADTGVPEGYIGVYDIEDLYCIRYGLDKNYILMADIDMTEDTAEGGDWDNGYGWAPIGEDETLPFTGTFDGNGHTIKGMQIRGIKTSYAGLFGCIKGKIKNLCIKEAYISTDKQGIRIGVLSGLATDSEIINLSVQGTITYNSNSGSAYIGGLVGRVYCQSYDIDYLFYNCVNDVEIEATLNEYYQCYGYIGGITGYINMPYAYSGGKNYISHCYNLANLNANSSLSSYYDHYLYVGGISGYIEDDDSKTGTVTKIENCYNKGNIFASANKGNETIGGISGLNGKIVNCINLGQIESVGTNSAIAKSSNISQCYYLKGTASSGVFDTTDTTTTAVPLTATQMKLKSVYGYLDFDNVWFIEKGMDYPQLISNPETAIEHTHNYVDVVTAPTCTAQGYTTHTCSCGDSYVDTYVNATGHSFGSWQTTKAATCTAKGTETRTCSRCTATETRDIAAKGHSYTTKVTAPTCTAQGYTTHTCSVCGNNYKDTYTNATGHKYTSKVTKEATCTATGVKTFTCSCGDSYTETIKALGHDYKTTVTKPTCTEKGYTTHKCSRCSDSYKDTYVNATGHKEGEWKVTKPATTTSTGTKTLYCSVCGAVIRTETIPKIDPSKGKVKSVSIGDVELNYKDSAKLNPKIEADSGVKYTVTYKSSDSKIATVDNNGNVKGTKDWISKSATITCTVTDEFGNVVTDTCKVTCGYAWWQWIVGTILFGFIWY